MSENLHDIDKIFKDAIEDHKDSPGEDVWKSIEQKLDKSNVVSINKKYQRLKSIAAVLLLLLGAAAVYEIANYTNSKKENRIAGDKGIKNDLKTMAVKTDSLKFKNEKKNSVAPIFASSSVTENNNIALSTDTSSNTNKNFHLRNNRSQTGGFTGDSLNQKSNDAATEKESYKRDKNSTNKKSNLSATIKNGGVDVLEEQAITGSREDEQLKRYYGVISSSSYQNNFYKFLSEILVPGKINLTSTVRPLPENNIVKSSPLKNKKTARPVGISITPFYSPDISFNNLQDDHPHQGPGRRDDKHDIKNDEKHGYAYTLGLLAEVELSKKLSLQSGLSFSKSATNTQAKNIYAEKDNAGNTKYRVNSSCGYGYIQPPPNTNPLVGDSIKALDAKNTLQYLSVPLALKYSAAMGKFAFVSSAGVQINFLTKGQIKTTTDNGSIKQTQAVNTVEGLKKSYLGAIVSAGVQYSVNKKIDLQFLPTAKFGLNSINNGATVKTFSNSIGLSAGVKIKL